MNKNKSRQNAWWQASVVRRSSSAVDEAVDELTEKSRFLLKRSPRSSGSSDPATTTTTPPTSTTSTSRLDSTSEEWPSSSSSSPDEPTATPPRNNSSNDEKQQQQQQQHRHNNEHEVELPTIASFHREEIQVGKLLGEGTFSCVYEVTGFHLEHHRNESFDDDDENDYGDTNNLIRSREMTLRQDLIAAQPGSFALKHLKPDLLTNSKDFEDAAIDLAMETKYLAAFDHPGILKCRGVPCNGTAAFANTSGGHYCDGYFLLTDRLEETLAHRIDRWQQGESSDTNTVLCKTRYALQIAQALVYLHERRIMFRDLKPSNIGFKQTDDSIQLFDFGLCRELPPPIRGRTYKYYPFVREDGELDADDDDDDEREEYSATMEMDESWNEFDESEWEKCARQKREQEQQQQQQQYLEEVYLMSGAGTQIYMAPEILINNRYNLKADVYSFAMTFTEMLLLEKPLPWYEMDDHIQFVCREGDRPCLEDHGEIPESLKDLLEWAWIGDVSRRCSMTQVCDELQDIILQLERDQKEGILPSNKSFLQLPARVLGLVGRMKSFVNSILERLLSFFYKNRDEDVGSDLLPSSRSSKATEPNAAATLDDGSTTSSTTDLPKRQETSDEPSFPASSQSLGSLHAPGDCSKGTDCNRNKATPRGGGRSTAVLKRKTSSASTTATTDDECDDEDLLCNSLSSSGLKSPMEVVAERQGSNVDTSF